MNKDKIKKEIIEKDGKEGDYIIFILFYKLTQEVIQCMINNTGDSQPCNYY